MLLSAKNNHCSLTRLCFVPRCAFAIFEAKSAMNIRILLSRRLCTFRYIYSCRIRQERSPAWAPMRLLRNPWESQWISVTLLNPWETGLISFLVPVPDFPLNRAQYVVVCVFSLHLMHFGLQFTLFLWLNLCQKPPILHPVSEFYDPASCFNISA